ncbi:MAG TPA: hypothetical protein VMQ60_09635 [Acidobacteriaceae bacterium]|jgi:hypothetical protein|nr:hypothetical protein [Acidobacteriaceae bacterium]
MPGVSLDAVWKTRATLPGVVRSTAYGSPALKVGGQLMACVPINKSAEPGSLMLRGDRNARQTLLDDAPELYYVTDHYLGYDAVLVRLERLNRELLLDLLAMAHRFSMRKGKRRAYGANGGELLVRYRNIQARH